MRVHSALGNGFQEVIYQRALEIEMNDEGIPFKREFEMPIFYKRQQIGTRRVDFLTKDDIILVFTIFFHYQIGRCAFGSSNQLFRSLRYRSGIAYQFWS